MTVPDSMFAQIADPEAIAALSGGFTATLLGWVALYVALLVTWAVTTSRLTVRARKTLGRSALIRWVSAIVGLTLFVAIPAFAARMLLPGAILLSIAPGILATVLLTRTGTSLAKGTAIGTGRTTFLAYRLFLRAVTTALELAWMALRAVVSLDWARLQKLPDVAREMMSKLPIPGLQAEVRDVKLLEASGLPLDPGNDPRLKAFPKSVPERLTRLLTQGLTLRASEAVLTADDRGHATVRFRIDGTMVDGPAIAAEEAELVGRAAKALAGLNPGRSTSPQDGAFPVMSGDRRSDVYVTTAPSSDRETIVLRITVDERALYEAGLDELGIDDTTLKAMRTLLGNNEGLILVTGRADSGRSTTIYSSISEAQRAGRTVATVEKSVRHRLENVPQVKPDADSAGFTRAIDSALRNDPDVLVVRDIIDRETAELCMRTALAGRLVIAGFLADDAASALQRLCILGVDRGLMRLALTGITSQRLARKLCDACKQAYEPTPELLEKLGIQTTKRLQFCRETGCQKCRGTGFIGRTGIFELLEVNDGVKTTLAGEFDGTEARNLFHKLLTRSMKSAGFAKVRHGESSLQEVKRVLK